MGGSKRPPSLNSVTYILQWWNLVELYLTSSRSRKHMNHLTHLLVFADISVFLPKTSKFCYIKKYRHRLHIDKQLLIPLTYFEFLKIALIKMVQLLMMSAKMATLGFLKIKVFWKNGYEVIMFVHDATNKISSRDSNCIVDVVIWPKFGNSSIYIREVIMTWFL